MLATVTSSTAAKTNVLLYLTPTPTLKDTSPYAVVKDLGKLAPVLPIIISTAFAGTEETTIGGFAVPVKQSLVAKTVRVRNISANSRQAVGCVT